MQTQDENNNKTGTDTTDPSTLSKARQQQSDPQVTELKGFFDPKEDLEPTLEDGKKAPDKAPEEHKNNMIKGDD